MLSWSSTCRGTYGLPKAAPGAVKPRSGVATGVGVEWESERTGKTEEKTRVWCSMADCGGGAGPRFEGGAYVVSVRDEGGLMSLVVCKCCLLKDCRVLFSHSGGVMEVQW